MEIKFLFAIFYKIGFAPDTFVKIEPLFTPIPNKKC